MQKIKPITEEQYQNICQFNREIMEAFLSDSTELSPKTLATYKSNLAIWFVWLAENLDNIKQTDVKPLQFKRFQNWLQSRDCSSADINNKRAACSSLNNYIEVYYPEYNFRNFINKSIARPPSVRKKEKLPLTKIEFDNLVSILKEKSELQKVAFLMFALETGARKGEIRQLLRNIVEAKPIVKEKDGKQVISYLTPDIRCKGRGKAGKVRKFIFGESTMVALKEWVNSRDDQSEWMFIHKISGVVKQVGETTFNTWLDSMEPLVGRKIFPHLLRSSRATQLSEEDGVKIEKIQKLLGHTSSQVTQIYIKKNENDDLDDLLL